jgi:hypothetical protein
MMEDNQNLYSTILPFQKIKDSQGRILFYGLDSFTDEIVNGDSCFICGANPSEKEFNDEHVIPDWILRKYGLHSKEIRLPNSETIKYAQYKVPCCSDCNTLLGKTIETPLSEIIEKGYSLVYDYIKSEGYKLLFNWLALIFFKTNLRTTKFRFFLDKRKPDLKISDFIHWESIHHIHCIVRSFYTGAKLGPGVLGSFLLVPMRNDPYESFDYGDNLDGKGIMIKLGEIGLIAILNDSGASLTLFQDEVNKINAPLTPLQLRELMVRLAYYNCNLKERPLYQSEIWDNHYRIHAELPATIEFQDNKQVNFGNFLMSGCYPLIENQQFDNKDFVVGKMREGNYTFLFDNDGNFIDSRNVTN